MSMHVDLSKPLTRESVEYLASRGRYAELDRAQSLTGSEVPDLGAGDGTGPLMRPLGTAEDQAGERQRLLDRLAELDAVNATADETPDPDGEDLEPYEAWPVKELDAELKARELPVTGDKAAKVKALYADDEAKNTQA